jgi:hypothetical protein
LLAAALLPLGIPLVNRGAAWVALGGALAAACLALAVCPRPAPLLRLSLALALAALGYAPALTSRLAGAGESPPPVLQPATGDFTPGPALVSLRGRGRPGGPPLRSSAMGPPDRSPLGPLALPTPGEPVPLAAPPGADAEPRLAARVAEAVAAEIDPAGGAALLLTRRGALCHYSYPDFRLLGSYRLERPGYRAALGPGGLLFVASPAAGVAIDREGTPGEVPAVPERNPLPFSAGNTRAPGDVHVYDVRALLRGGERPGAELRPVVTFADRGPVPSMVLSPDGLWLYYLGLSPQRATLYRVGVDRRALDNKQPLPQSQRSLTRWWAGALALSPDGRVLYATTPTGMVRIDPTSLQEEPELTLPFTAHGLAATNEGRVFVGSRGERPVVLALDLRRREAAVLGHYLAPFPGRLYLRLSPDGRRLYLGTSSLLADRIVAVRVDGEHVRRPRVEATFATDENGLVRGDFQISPDGRFLLNRWGKVYRLPDAD